MVSDAKVSLKKSETNSKRKEKQFVKQQIQNKQKIISSPDSNLNDKRIVVFSNNNE